VNSSDYQDLPDGGIVRGVAGGEYGVIFQETAMPPHGLRAGLAGDLQHRAHHRGQGADGAVFADPRRR